MNILIISGTNRDGSMSLKIANKLLKQYEAIEGVQASILDLRELPQEIFSPTIYKDKPESFKPFQEKVLKADGILFIVPEYNGSYPGVLKYFIDMWTYPESFEGRCMAYFGISAGVWGGLRSVEHLQGVMGYRNAFQFPERVFVNNIYSRWDWESGVLKKLNEKEFDLEELLYSQTKNFIRFCRNNR
jgi:NAD(P)H-dependent FMN reductase